MQEYAQSLLYQMLQIPSASYQERELATYLVEQMRQLGFHSFIDEAGNLVGEKGETHGPLILLVGHMDTVSDFFAAHQEGRLLYGRGAVDAKGPLATMICAAAQATAAPARLVVIGAVEEETPGSRGAHYLLDRYTPDAVIIGEPSGWSSAVIGYKGRVGLVYEVQRPPVHTASPEEKASECAFEFWQRLADYITSTAGNKSLFHRLSATLCRFEGDITKAHLEITCRTPPGFDFATFEQFLETIRCDAHLHIDERTPGILMDRDNAPTRALIQSIRNHSGKVKLKVKTGTTDMNILCKQWQVPMVAYGPGDSSLDHTANEHIDLDEYLTAINVLHDALFLLSNELYETQMSSAYSEEEELELTHRLEALGYLE